MKTQVLTLTASEVLLSEDKLRNEASGTEEMQVCIYALLLKLGSALLVLTEGNKIAETTLEVAFTEEELWLLRGVTHYDEKTAADAQYGIKLKRKLYTALLAVNGLDELPTASEVPSYTDAQALERLKSLPKEEPHV